MGELPPDALNQRLGRSTTGSRPTGDIGSESTASTQSAHPSHPQKNRIGKKHRVGKRFVPAIEWVPAPLSPARSGKIS